MAHRFAALGLFGAWAREVYTDNPVCVQNNCINPIFPGLEDLHRLSNTTKWYCTSMEDTALSVNFCKGAVNYDIAVPEPRSEEERSVQALVRKQDRAANTAFFTHMSGMGKDAWEYANPGETDDDCVKSIWKMVCYTYFPRAKAGCARGGETDYIRPCKSSCQNYIKACSVECCDESVQCVFDQKPPSKTTVTATSGYEPHDGPSTFCTGGAYRSSIGLAALLAMLGMDFSGLSLGSSKWLLLAAAAATSLQGCDGVVEHSVGNWRQQDDYLVRFQFVPPGASAKEAVLNSCSLPGLSPTLQCSGHGGCHAWDKTADSNPTPFCKCDSEWADPECRTKRKSQAAAYFLAIFLGLVGADRFYLGLTLSGWLKLATLGSLSVFWVTEVLITGSAPVNLGKDLRSWSGLLKVLIFAALGSWYFVDIIRTGSAPVETSGFKTSPDLPREAFVACTVFLAMIAGFLFAGWNVVSDAVKDAVSLLDVYGLRKEHLTEHLTELRRDVGVANFSADLGPKSESKAEDVLQRSEQDYLGATSSDITRHFRNADPDLHPFERAREYQRALKAVKLEKLFAKPLVKALEGHTDSVKCMAVARIAAAPLLTGSCNGELRLWNMQHLVCGSSVTKAHEGFVRGVTMNPDGRRAISCGDDKAAKMWGIGKKACTISEEPQATFHMAYIPGAIDHHWRRPMFVTVGDTVDVWDYNRSAPLSTFEWGCERVITARFNPAEAALLASTAVDRSVGLYDLRENSPIRKVVLKMRSNGICWNPMRPMNFTVANEDCSLYTFDMRNLSAATCRHWDHVMAVLDVDYAPSGQEFVSGSYDNTVRIWDCRSQRSKQVYHGKRMQRVLCCHFTPDGRFVLSGSEDTNIRVWKAKPDQKLGVATPRESRAEARRRFLKMVQPALVGLSRGTERAPTKRNMAGGCFPKIGTPSTWAVAS
ncbi:unnamed protein product [Effrenium voratum]|nr:unnamed protein product [Effrenium voratum]